MPAIYENLKTLRQTRGFSQAEVADAINVTRQTVSSYETGRTQPDLETLKHLAELYEADLYDVLYGGNRLQRKMKVLRRTAFVISTVFLLSLLIHSALFLINNTFFTVENGTRITDENRQLLELRFAILDIANYAAKLGTGIFCTGCLILLYPLITMENPIPVKTCIAWLIGLIIATFLVVIPFMMNDKIYGYADYLLPIWSALPSMVFVFLVSVVTNVVKKIKRRKVNLS